MANAKDNNAEAMSNEKSSDIGRFARHPLRTMGGSMLAGMSVGAGMMAAKHKRARSPMQRIMNRMGR